MTFHYSFIWTILFTWLTCTPSIHHPNLYDKWSITSWSKSRKTCNFQNCIKLKSLNFQWWQCSISHLIFFFYWKIQLEVLYNSVELGFEISNTLHDFSRWNCGGWSNFRIGIGLVKCQFKVKKAFKVLLVRNEMSTSFFHRVFMYSMFNALLKGPKSLWGLGEVGAFISQ